MGENVPVVGVNGVTIHCPSEGRYAFYNSPYPAHRLSTGIDIYPRTGFGESAVSPVSGRVILVRKVRAPKARWFRDHGHDSVILLESQENPERVIKILHVEPSIQEGDILETGQTLGTLIRSGYFGYSTAPHIHLEVRRPGDPLRARGGLRFKRLQKIENVPEMEDLEGLVYRCVEEYMVDPRMEKGAQQNAGQPFQGPGVDPPGGEPVLQDASMPAGTVPAQPVPRVF